MKAPVACSLLLLGGSATACDGQAPATVHPAVGQRPATGTAPTAASAARPAPAAPYEVRGVVDPGINNEVALALKIPRGWHFQQSFTREWNGATPVAQIYLHVTAPDGQRQIEFLPERPYYFVDGPMANGMRQQAAALGIPRQPGSQYELAPMPALTYLKRVLLPRLAQRGLHLQATGEHEQPLPPQAGARRSQGYVDGRLPNGRLARIECLVTVNATNVNGETYYNWSALSTITQAPTDLPATFAYVTAARASLVFNPAWQRQNGQLVSNGQRSNRVETQKRQAIEQDFQQYQARINKEITANRQASADRRNEAFSDAMRGEAKYENTATGERVKVQDSYNHVYADGQGNTLSTNAPLDAGHVNWQELQRVEMKNY